MSRSRREWNEEMRALARRMNQLMDEWMHARFRGDPEEFWEPAADVIECDRFICITCELAGVKREKVEVSVAGDTVTISGERLLPHVNGQMQVHQMELGHGAFRRTIRLPFAPPAGGFAVKYQAGLLEVRVPKPDLPP